MRFVLPTAIAVPCLPGPWKSEAAAARAAFAAAGDEQADIQILATSANEYWQLPDHGHLFGNTFGGLQRTRSATMFALNLAASVAMRSADRQLALGRGCPTLIHVLVQVGVGVVEVGGCCCCCCWWYWYW
jgi:hypothetical protein